MYKLLLSLLIICFVCDMVNVNAKSDNARPDTTAYYMTSQGQLAQDKNQAAFIRSIFPSLPGEDTTLVNINDYYLNGKRKLVAKSSVNNINFQSGIQGYCLEFYENGHKRSIRNYNKGHIIGDAIEYYPNGGIYNMVNYDNNIFYLKACQDSTGKVLAENGNGAWIKFDDNFKYPATGAVLNGKPNGEWRGTAPDSVKYILLYENGAFMSSDTYFKSGKAYHSIQYEAAPQFEGGDAAFGNFIMSNVRYPSTARKNHIEGRVNVSFVIDRDGSVSDVKVVKGIGGGCDEEAVRVLKSSAPWRPGIQIGVPVRVQYTVPIQFKDK